MKKIFDFNHKEARRIINENYDGDSRIIDNEGNVYDYISKIQNKFRGDDYFYAKKADEKDFKYIFFTVDGKSIQKDLNLTLYIEKNVDFGKFDILKGEGLESDVVYLKLTCQYEYLVFSLQDKFKPFIRGIVYYDWFGLNQYHKVSHAEEDEIYKKLYEINLGYDVIRHVSFPLVKNLEKGTWYKYYNTIFQVKEDYNHDLRDICDIPYIYNIRLDSDIVYKDSIMGLPKNICMQKADYEDISIAKKIISKYGNKQR